MNLPLLFLIFTSTLSLRCGRNLRMCLPIECPRYKTIHQHARQSLEKTREAIGHYYDQKAKQQPDFKVGDLVLLNAKNIRIKQPSKKLALKLYGPFKVLEQ